MLGRVARLAVLAAVVPGCGGGDDASPSAPSLVARSIRIENGEYVFDAAVRLEGGRQYWFGTDSNVGYLPSQRTNDIYPGGDLYFSGSLTGGEDSYVRAFVVSQSERLDAGFTLRGARVQ